MLMEGCLGQGHLTVYEPLYFVLPEPLTVTCLWGWSDATDGVKSSSAFI